MEIRFGRKTTVTILVGLLLGGTLGTGVDLGETVTESDAKQETITTESDVKTKYKAIVIFRNDDVQPYYKSEVRKKVDQIFIEERVPVTEAVIPAARNTPIKPEQPFCKHLRRQKQSHPEVFEYALHGYNHQQETRFKVESKQFFSGSVKSEFAGVNASRQRAKIRRGTRILRECTGENPEVFVPPFGTYSNKTVEILDQNGYLAVSGGGWFTRSYYGQSGDLRYVQDPFYAGGLLHLPRSKAFVENWTTGEFYPMESLKDRFDRAYENNSVYVQMIHYPIYTSEERLQKLRQFIHYVKKHEKVKFLTLGEFARSYENGRLKEVEDGWVYEPRSELNRSTNESESRLPAA